jgi:hypothetical protein
LHILAGRLQGDAPEPPIGTGGSPPPIAKMTAQIGTVGVVTYRFLRLAPSLAGRVPLGKLPLPDDAALVRRLLDHGILHNLHVSRDSVRTSQFCDYLYARIGRWRTRKAADQWP